MTINNFYKTSSILEYVVNEYVTTNSIKSTKMIVLCTLRGRDSSKAGEILLATIEKLRNQVIEGHSFEQYTELGRLYCTGNRPQIFPTLKKVFIVSRLSLIHI